MLISPSPTELTTGATDAVLAVECILIAVFLRRSAAGDRWRAGLWCWVLGLMAFSSLLGAAAHGFDMRDAVREALWKPLYISLGILVALFVVGAVHDWRGRAAAGRLIPWCFGLGIVFFAVTECLQGVFIVFVMYETVAMLSALAVYALLAVTRRLKGARLIVVSILIDLAAAAVQASEVSVRIWFPFDHNGIFHLVQMVAIGALGIGLHLGMRREAR